MLGRSADAEISLSCQECGGYQYSHTPRRRARRSRPRRGSTARGQLRRAGAAWRAESGMSLWAAGQRANVPHAMHRVVEPDVLAAALAQQASEHAHAAIEHEQRGETVPTHTHGFSPAGECMVLNLTR